MKKLFTVIIIIIIILIVGISLKSNADKELIDYTVKDINEFLTDKKLEGRLTGTEGNKKAEEFISKYFKSLNFETIKDDTYLFPYDHDFINFENQDIKMVIEYKNGNTREFILGEDFLPRSYKKEVNINAPISKELDEKSFLLLDDNMKQEYVKAKGILIKTKYFHHNIGIANNKPVIQISENLYNDLANNECNIRLSYTINVEKIQANNVVGKISGEDNNSAIILTAHFDHVGKMGDTIYYGALDNSSGVSVLLDLAKKLKEYSKDNIFKQDIIICAFNGEESGRQGSKVFSTFIKDKYKNICNINFDCIGIKDSAFAINECIDSGRKNLLNNDLYDYFKNRNYDIDWNDSSTSDGASFMHYNIPSVDIGQPDFDIIHSKLDTVDKLDMNLIEKFSNDMFKFIIENDGINYNEVINTSNDLDIEYVDEVEDLEYKKMLESEAKDLELNQYKHIIFDNYPTCISKQNKTYNSLKNLKKIFNNINIPKNIDNYELQDIIVYCFNTPEIATIGEIGKVYTYDNFSVSNINNILIKYLDKDDSNKILEIHVIKSAEKSVDDIINEQLKYSECMEKISDNNQCYWIDFIEDKNHIFNHIFNVINVTENDGIFYTIRIDKYKLEKRKIKGEDTDVRISDWFNHSKDKTIKFMKIIDFKKLIHGIFG